MHSGSAHKKATVCSLVAAPVAWKIQKRSVTSSDLARTGLSVRQAIGEFEAQLLRDAAQWSSGQGRYEDTL